MTTIRVGIEKTVALVLDELEILALQYGTPYQAWDEGAVQKMHLLLLICCKRII